MHIIQLKLKEKLPDAISDKKSDCAEENLNLKKKI